MPKPVKVVVVAKDKDARIRANRARAVARHAAKMREAHPKRGEERFKRRFEKQREWADRKVATTGPLT